MKNILCVLAVILGCAGAAYAGDVVTLDSLVVEAIDNNPELRAARARWEASQKRPKQEGTLPDPMIGVDWQNVTFDSITLEEDPNSMLRFSVSQEIPFPGKLSLKEKIASIDADAEGESYKASERKVAADLKSAYYDWQLTLKAIEITQKNKSLLEKFTEIAKIRYEVGKAAQQDMITAGVETSKFLEQIEVLDLRREIIEARINSILGRSTDAPLGKPEEPVKVPLPFSPEEAGVLAEKNSPALAVKESMVTSGQESLALARKELYPDFVVGLSPGVMGGMDGKGMDGVWEVSLGLKVPLYFWRKQSLGVEEAALNLKGAEEEYRNTNREVQFSVKESYLSARTSEKLMDLYEKGIIPQSRLALESAISAYQTGSVDFSALLDSLMTVFSFELEYERNLAEYLKALARIEEYTGVEIAAVAAGGEER
jgi:outer membrane protein TolC